MKFIAAVLIVFAILVTSTFAQNATNGTPEPLPAENDTDGSPEPIPPEILPLSFIAEVSGLCTSMCRREVNRALREAGLPCEVADRVATIKTKTFVLISRFGLGQTVQNVSPYVGS